MDFKSIINDLRYEALKCLKLLFSPAFWIFLPSFLAMSSIYIAHARGASWYLAKGTQENSAYWILGVTIAVFAVSALRFRDTLSCFLLVLSVNLLLREMDAIPLFGEVQLRTKGYIYCALGVMAAWGIWKRKKILPFIDAHSAFATLLLAVGVGYLFSQLVARGVFKLKRIPVFPYVDHLHVAMEEVIENFTHSTLLIAACFYLAIKLIEIRRRDQKSVNSEE